MIWDSLPAPPKNSASETAKPMLLSPVLLTRRSDFPAEGFAAGCPMKRLLSPMLPHPHASIRSEPEYSAIPESLFLRVMDCSVSASLQVGASRRELQPLSAMR